MNSYRVNNSPVENDVNRRYLEALRGWSGVVLKKPLKLKTRAALIVLLRLAMLPLLLLTGLLVMIGLRISLLLNGRRTLSSTRSLALSQLPSLVKQYPFHFYPTVAKALEIAFIKEQLSGHLGKQEKFLEVAIGEGTLSARVFEGERNLTASDMNPYSLAKASRHDHVCRAIVCDGQRLPVRAGAFDLLLSTNFISHVTLKETTIASWARSSKTIIFNDETPYWLSSWTFPYLLKTMGFHGLAKRRTRPFQERFCQHLLHKADLEKQIEPSAEIEAQYSFLSERSFFYANLASLFLLTPGAPTPEIFKKLFLGPLSFLMLPFSTKLAELLIRFDAYQDRSADAFLIYACRTKAPAAEASDSDLICPRCDGSLTAENRCEKCGTLYPVEDGMLFLLPDELDYLVDEYRSEVAASMLAEHL